MGDLVKDVKYLRFYHTSEEMTKDKDILKNQSFDAYANRVSTLFLLPLGFQFWQLSLVNNFEKVALYRKVRVLKALSFMGAVAFGIKEKLNLEYQWQYYDRFYPEATELQKTLTREAMAFKEGAFQAQMPQLDLDTERIYESMYRLPAQTHPDPDDNPNPPTIKKHY